MAPSRASSRCSMRSSSACNDACDSASRCDCSTSMKRDMCVPFWSAGSATVMSTDATLGWGPRAVATSKGWVSDFTPTRWMAMLRASAADWTSGRYMLSGAFMARPLLSPKSAAGRYGAIEGLFGRQQGFDLAGQPLVQRFDLARERRHDLALAIDKVLVEV